MAIGVRKYVNREFSKTVDLELLRRFLTPYLDHIALDWATLPEDEKEKREAVFELFRLADGRFPSSLQFALFNIATLSSDAGANILLAQVDEAGVELVPPAETDGEQDGRHLNPRHLALLAYLDHRTIFDRALDAAAFLAHSAPLELNGAREGVDALHETDANRKAFSDAVSEYFSKRYQGRYCDIRWFAEDDSIRVLVLHGSKASIKNVEEDGGENTLKYREITQDAIRYNGSTGNISVGAKSAPDAKKLVKLFARHLLDDEEFFENEGAGDLYTLEPINRRGKDFKFNSGWDENVTDVRIREIQVDEGRHMVNGRMRYSPWAMTVRDTRDALRRLDELGDGLDFADLRINYIKLEFWLDIDGKESRITVKVKPPGLASMRDHSHERLIMEHLERNGIRRGSPSQPASAAAE